MEQALGPGVREERSHTTLEPSSGFAFASAILPCFVLAGLLSTEGRHPSSPSGHPHSTP